MKKSHGSHLLTSHGLLDLDLALLSGELVIDLANGISELSFKSGCHSLLLLRALSLCLLILLDDSSSDIFLAFKDLATEVFLKDADLI